VAANTSAFIDVDTTAAGAYANAVAIEARIRSAEIAGLPLTLW